MCHLFDPTLFIVVVCGRPAAAAADSPLALASRDGDQLKQSIDESTSQRPTTHTAQAQATHNTEWWSNKVEFEEKLGLEQVNQQINGRF